MLKYLSFIELLLSAGLLLLTVWAASGNCHGRPYGYDCESWLIFAINLFLPLGLLALVASLWSLGRRSWRPQYGLAVGGLGLLAYWLLHAW